MNDTIFSGAKPSIADDAAVPSVEAASFQTSAVSWTAIVAGAKGASAPSLITYGGRLRDLS